jgi:DNA-directed RNA polymerase specialized sigma24 family protein
LQHKKKCKVDEHKKKMAVFGIVERLEEECSHLPPEHKEVLILRLAGLCSGEIANALNRREMDINQIFSDAVTRLQEAQQGEQMPTEKLLGAKVDSCFSATS